MVAQSNNHASRAKCQFLSRPQFLFAHVRWDTVCNSHVWLDAISFDAASNYPSRSVYIHGRDLSLSCKLVFINKLQTGPNQHSVSGFIHSFSCNSYLEHKAPFGVSVITHIQTHGRTPLDEWSARRRELYLHRTTKHKNVRDKYPCPEQDSKPRSL
jgi:hypothetical protein